MVKIFQVLYMHVCAYTRLVRVCMWACDFVYMRECVYVREYTYVHACVCTCFMRMCSWACMRASVCACKYVCVRLCMRVGSCIHTRMWLRVCVRSLAYAYLCEYVWAYVFHFSRKRTVKYQKYFQVDKMLTIDRICSNILSLKVVVSRYKEVYSIVEKSKFK